MPVMQSRCGCCGRQQYECPKCGSSHVTPLDNPQQKSPTDLAILGPGPFTDSKETYHNVCWDCGWMEKVTVEVSWETENVGQPSPGIL